MERIINSVLDTDLYKITMGQAVFRNYDRINVGYNFINRNKTPFPEGFTDKLQQQLQMMSELKMTAEEKDFLEQRCGHYLRPGFIDWLSHYQFNPNEVSINQKDGDLSIRINGPWYRTIYWEVPLMALVSELYFKETNQQASEEWEKWCTQKAFVAQEGLIKLAEFGTRRRYSQEIQERVIQIFKKYAPDSLLGTSNVDLARRYNLTPVGTFAHEWVMGHAGMFGNVMATQTALETWAKEFDGSLGIALTDTFTTDAFLRDFTQRYAKLFDGVRQDSGSPEAFADKIINHYKKFAIDPLSKKIVFSDSLTMKRALEIENYCRGRITTMYGIGTHLTNDVGVSPLNIVIKLAYLIRTGEFTKIPVVKISDDIKKATGDPAAIGAAKYDFRLLA